MKNNKCNSICSLAYISWILIIFEFIPNNYIHHVYSCYCYFYGLYVSVITVTYYCVSLSEVNE